MTGGEIREAASDAYLARAGHYCRCNKAKAIRIVRMVCE